MPLLAPTISNARRRSLVGWQDLRASLVDLFGAPPPNVFYLHGVGGIGKSSFVNWIELHCLERGLRVKQLDGRLISDDFRLAGGVDLFTIDLDIPLANDPNLDVCLREQLVPSLSTGAQLVIANRTAPSPAWLADPGLASITRFVELDGWTQEESSRFLNQDGMDQLRLTQILEFACGHPLALSLAMTAAEGHESLDDGALAGIASKLAERFIDGATTAAQRESLDVVGLVPEITEDVLSATIGDQSGPLFSWLQGQSFMRSASTGLVPHPLAKEAFDRSLRWRNPARFQLLHDKVRTHLLGRLSSSGGAEAERLIFDLVHLHRDNPVIQPYIPGKTVELLATGRLGAHDHDTVLTMIEVHEGREARSWAARLLEDHLGDVVVVRNQKQQVVGCAFVIGLPWSPDRVEADPALRLASDYLGRFRRGQVGTAALYVRFWMSADGYQEVNPVQATLLAAVARRMLAEERLRFSFVATSEPDRWEPAFSYVEFERIAEIDFDCGPSRYGVFGHDWETITRKRWLDHLRVRETATGECWELPIGPARDADRVEAEIRIAAIDALKAFRNPAALRSNPLIHSRWVNQRVPEGADLSDRVPLLEALIQEAVSSLRGSARDLKLHRAVHHTHLQPASTQEQVAELLGLPFSTYRRHLIAGRKQVAQHICALELDR